MFKKYVFDQFITHVPIITIDRFLNDKFLIPLYLKLNTIWHINISMKHHKSTSETHNCLCLMPLVVATYAPAFLPTYLHMFFTWPNIYLTTYSPTPHLLVYLASTLTSLLTFLPSYKCFVGLATYLTTYLLLAPSPTNLSIY